MKTTLGLVLAASAAVVVGCGGAASGPWFDGSYEDALAVAATRDSVVMVEFYTDWCTWCRRLESDTFTAPEVRRELEKLVPIRINAEKKGEALAHSFGVDGYPTVIFVDADGVEVDRLVGYLPPERFLEEVRRIRHGDTFAACLTRLKSDPADWSALERAVEGLLERSDPEAAISKVLAYHEAAGEQADPRCRVMLSQARAALQERLYRRAAKLYQQGWDEPLRVPDAAGAPRLQALVADRPALQDTKDSAIRLREARTADGRALFEGLDLGQMPSELLLESGGFAYRSGNYDLAAELFVRWFRTPQERRPPDALNAIAWNLYLMGRELPTALEMAREAYAGNPAPGVADTLGRLLYLSGRTDEAVKVQSAAAAEAEGGFADEYRQAAERMRLGEPLGDVPEFELYPWGSAGRSPAGESSSSLEAGGPSPVRTGSVP